MWKIMTKQKLLSNLRIDKLDKKTDYLGIIDKGEIIRDFLIGSKDSYNEIKMFSLYGDWGSGKSSLMKYLENELQSDFNTFFFEAWEFEKDENLAMSLLDFIRIKSNSSSETFYADLLKSGTRILRGMGKSLKLNIPLFPGGPEMEINPSAFIEEISRNEELSFYEALENFKKDFQRLEDFLTLDDKPKYNIVFIDDLDRCEPEQVLNLMSAIKLFFTYGKKTIFLCGIDKKAVQEAVKTKYGKVVKANEYLEKIFDISFSMPDHNDLIKMINYYFDNKTYTIGNKEEPINTLINTFFTQLEFTNPRRVKKVLNKLQMLREFRLMKSNKVENFPNIDMKNNSESGLFETFLTLYLIILHEFYQSDFENFLNFDKKRDIYSKAAQDQGQFLHIAKAIRSNLSNIPFPTIYSEAKSNGLALVDSSFFICLSPINVKKISSANLLHNKGHDIYVSEKHIDFLFYKYINKKNAIEWLEKSQNNSTFISIKNLIKNFL